MDNKHPVEQVVLRERFVYHLLSRRVKQGLNLCDLILSAGINHINTEYLIVHSHESITICKPEELGVVIIERPVRLVHVVFGKTFAVDIETVLMSRRAVVDNFVQLFLLCGQRIVGVLALVVLKNAFAGKGRGFLGAAYSVFLGKIFSRPAGLCGEHAQFCGLADSDSLGGVERGGFGRLAAVESVVELHPGSSG